MMAPGAEHMQVNSPPSQSHPPASFEGRSSLTSASAGAHPNSNLVIFQVEAKVGFGEDVYVSGDTPSLGNFDPKHAVQLFATTKSYPIWESPVVSLPKGRVVQYRYAVFSGGEFSTWERVAYPRSLRADDLADSAAAVSTAFASGLRKNKSGGGSNSGVGTSNSREGLESGDLEDSAQEAATTTSTDVLHVTPKDPPPPEATTAATPDLPPSSAAVGSGSPENIQSRFGDWTNESGPSFSKALGVHDGLIVASIFLPVLARREGGDPQGKWTVEWDREALLSLKSQLRVTRVGTVRCADGAKVPPPGADRDALTQALHAYNCVPVYLGEPLMAAFYSGFCKQTLWPVFHNSLEIYGQVPTGKALGPQAARVFTDANAQARLAQLQHLDAATQSAGSPPMSPTKAPPPPAQPSQQQPGVPPGSPTGIQVDDGNQEPTASPPLPVALDFDAAITASLADAAAGVRGGSSMSSRKHPSMDGSGGSGGNRSTSRSSTPDEGAGPPSQQAAFPLLQVPPPPPPPGDGSPLYAGSGGSSAPADLGTGHWSAYMAVQRAFKAAIVEQYHEGDLVWIHGFHLLVVPTLVSKAHAAAKIGVFLHTPFPSSEIFRTLTKREDILRGMLSADQVGFHLYEYARHFLTCCQRLLGLEWTHDAQGMTVHYGGRSVLITCIHAGMDQDVLRSVVAYPQVQSEISALTAATAGKTVFAGIDRLERLKGLPLKLLAFERFLQLHPEHVGRVTLRQLALAANERGGDFVMCRAQCLALAARINAAFGEGTVVVEERNDASCQLQHRLALLSVADVFVTTTVRDGLNRWPLEYVLAQSYMCNQDQSNSSEDGSGEGGGAPPRHAPGLMVLSEFTSCCRVLNGALHVNPWKVDEVANAMQLAVTMDPRERAKRLEMDVEYAKVNTTAAWCGRVLQDLKGVKKSADASKYVTLGFGLNRRVTAMKAGFDQLDKGRVVKAYRKAARRLILLDYGGTLHSPEDADDSFAHYQQAALSSSNSSSSSSSGRGDDLFMPGKLSSSSSNPLKRNRPDPKVLGALRELCKDPRNRVFVLSGSSRAVLVDALGLIPGLGLVAESGFFYRKPEAKPLASASDPHASSHWEQLADGSGGLAWKPVATAVMQVYMERTHGVYLQEHETAVVWQFRDADPEFAMMQAKELEDQLKQLLKTLGAVVIRGDDYVEVRPAGVSKGDFISHLLGDAYVDEPPGFVLCVGDDLSDEKSYVTVRRFMRTAAIAASLAGLTPGGSWGPTRSTGTRSGPSKDLLTPSFAATDAATAATAANASGGGAGAGAAPTAAPAASAAAPVAPPSPRGPSGPQEPVYFTATVGKKPTVADSYMHQVDDVIELLESMSKTQALEKTMSMIDFAPSSTEAQRRSQQAAGGDGGAGFGLNLDVPPAMHVGSGAGGPSSGVGAAVGRSGVAAAAGLGPIAEFTGGMSTNIGGLGSGGEAAFGRSMSVPAMPTMKRPSSMMLTEYFTSIAEESSRGGDKKDEEGDEGVWF